MFIPLEFSATHSYVPASSCWKYGISRTPLAFLMSTFLGKGTPSTLLQFMDGTGLWEEMRRWLRFWSCSFQFSLWITFCSRADSELFEGYLRAWHEKTHEKNHDFFIFVQWKSFFFFFYYCILDKEFKNITQAPVMRSLGVENAKTRKCLIPHMCLLRSPPTKKKNVWASPCWTTHTANTRRLFSHSLLT